MANSKSETRDPAKSAPDFSYLKQVIPTAMADYELFELEGIAEQAPVLIVKCIQDNAKYLAAVKEHRPEVSRQIEQIQRSKGNRRLRQSDISADLLSPIDRQVYPGAVIVGWRHVPDSDRNPVEWSVENCKGFLQALPDSLFEGIRQFCAEPRNFRAEADDGNATEAAAKNS